MDPFIITLFEVSIGAAVAALFGGYATKIFFTDKSVLSIPIGKLSKNPYEHLIGKWHEYHVTFDSATTYEEGIQKISSLTYDLVILDIMGVRGFELLEYAVAKKLPVVMLTAHALSPETLKKSIELGARAYLPKDKMFEIDTILEDVLEEKDQPAGTRGKWFERVKGYFDTTFGAGWLGE